MDGSHSEGVIRGSAGGSKRERTGRDGSVGLLLILESSLDELRHLITCRVCVRPLFEPYTLECGHTFCYGCLVRWFERDRTKKTCPDCRAGVLRRPAPAYLVRDMTQVFANRAELMPVGETTEEHKKWQEEEAELIDKDRSSDARGELWRGCFRPHARSPKLRAAPIRDDEDGVDRCPRCTWELEDGQCESCGYHDAVTDLGDSDDLEHSHYHYDDVYDMEYEHGIDDDDIIRTLAQGHDLPEDFDYGDLESNDGFSVEGSYSPPPPARHYAHHRGQNPGSPLGFQYESLPDTEEDSGGDDDTGSLRGFVVSDEEGPPASASSSTGSVHWGRSHRESDEGTGLEGMQDSDDEGNSLGDNDSYQTEEAFPTAHYNLEDESDNVPLRPSRRRVPRISIVSDDSSSSEISQPMAASQNRRRRRITQGTVRDNSRHQRNIPHHTRDTDRNSVRPTVIELGSDSDSPVPPPPQRRRRPVLNRLSSDDEGTGVGASSGTATVGRQSPRPGAGHCNQNINRPQNTHTSNASSPVLVESTPQRSEYVENLDPTLPGAFLPSLPLSQRSHSVLSTISNSPTQEVSEGAGQLPTAANHRVHSSPGSSATAASHSSYLKPLGRRRQPQGSHLQSPLQQRPRCHSPASRPLPPPMGREERFEQGVRARLAQKIERREERSRLKAEQEQRRRARAQLSPSDMS